MHYNKLLIDDYPLIILPKLALLLGAWGAMIAQQIHYWCGTNSKHGYFEHEGIHWCKASFEDWQKNNFPFLSVATIKRTMKQLEDNRVVISCKPNASSSDHTKWYRIDYARLEELAISFSDGVILQLLIVAECNDHDDSNLQPSTYIETKEIETIGETATSETLPVTNSETLPDDSPTVAFASKEKDAAAAKTQAAGKASAPPRQTELGLETEKVHNGRVDKNNAERRAAIAYLLQDAGLALAFERLTGYRDDLKHWNHTRLTIAEEWLGILQQCGKLTAPRWQAFLTWYFKVFWKGDKKNGNQPSLPAVANFPRFWLMFEEYEQSAQNEDREWQAMQKLSPQELAARMNF